MKIRKTILTNTFRIDHVEKLDFLKRVHRIQKNQVIEDALEDWFEKHKNLFEEGIKPMVMENAGVI